MTNNSLASLSVEQLRRAVTVKEQIEALETELSQLLGEAAPAAAAAPVTVRRRRKMSAAARAKIGAAQKARWAKTKPSKTPKPVKTARRKMSAAARAKMAEVAKARWKKAKATGKTSLAG